MSAQLEDPRHPSSRGGLDRGVLRLSGPLDSPQNPRACKACVAGAQDLPARLLQARQRSPCSTKAQGAGLASTGQAAPQEGEVALRPVPSAAEGRSTRAASVCRAEQGGKHAGLEPRPFRRGRGGSTVFQQGHRARARPPLTGPAQSRARRPPAQTCEARQPPARSQDVSPKGLAPEPGLQVGRPLTAPLWTSCLLTLQACPHPGCTGLAPSHSLAASRQAGWPPMRTPAASQPRLEVSGLPGQGLTVPGQRWSSSRHAWGPATLLPFPATDQPSALPCRRRGFLFQRKRPMAPPLSL